jgi:ubiquitin C-terminal hydrolase
LVVFKESLPGELVYRLSAVVSHIGGTNSIESGHYVAYVFRSVEIGDVSIKTNARSHNKKTPDFPLKRLRRS